MLLGTKLLYELVFLQSFTLKFPLVFRNSVLLWEAAKKSIFFSGPEFVYAICILSQFKVVYRL